MPGRIITLQRQARELGRLRAGYTDHSGDKPRPVRSSTWIVTSHSRDYCQAAADAWGGTVEQWQPQGNGAAQYRVVTEAAAVDAILPPGDPISQAYEFWTRGGCARRCDGEVEQMSDQPCVCRAQWGDDFHQVAPAKDACKLTTRLSVILPDMPDLGTWRLETHSYYAANEIAATVDVLKGQLGGAAMVPVRLRIEPRTRVAQGKTKQFPVPVVELRGATAGQVMAGQVPTAVTGGQQPAQVTGQQAPALEDGGRPGTGRDWHAEVDRARTTEALRNLWREASAAGALDGDLKDLLAEKVDMVRQFEQTGSYAPSSGRAPEVDDTPAAEPAPAPADGGSDVDELWMGIVNAWQGTTSQLTDAYARTHQGELPGGASAEQLQQFLADIKAGRITVEPDDASTDSADDGTAATPF